MRENCDDAELIRASLDRPLVFGRLYDRYAEDLLVYLTRRINRSDVEDLLSDVFETAFKNRSRYDLERPNARPWLYGIAANRVLKYHRKSARRFRAVGRLAQRTKPAVPLVEDVVTEQLLAQQRLDETMEALSALRSRDREVVLLYAWHKLSYADIAEALEMPVGTVRSSINRARKILSELERARGIQLDNSNQHTQEVSNHE